MNAVTISILSLLLALTASGGGDVASKKTTDSEQVETSKNNTSGSLWGSLVGTSGVNLNHNETLVRDTQFKPPISGGCSPIVCGSNHNETFVRDATAGPADKWLTWVSNERLFAEVPLLFTLMTYRSGFGCSPTVCGTNHNETLVRDTQFKPPIGVGCSPLVCGSNHNETLVRDMHFKPAAGSGCAPWVCGANHSETLVVDAVASQPDEWRRWLSNEQPSANVPPLFTLMTYHSGFGCSPWICGSNHSETLVRDLVQ